MGLDCELAVTNTLVGTMLFRYPEEGTLLIGNDGLRPVNQRCSHARHPCPFRHRDFPRPYIFRIRAVTSRGSYYAKYTVKKKKTPNCSRSFSFKAFAVVAVMIARVRPSLNGAREALKTWDEASVVWPRFEVWTFTLTPNPAIILICERNFLFTITKEGFRAGGNEIKSPEAAGSERSCGHLRRNFRLALCTAVEREKTKTKTVIILFKILY